MDSLEELKKRLYKRGEKFEDRKRKETKIQREKIKTPSEWERENFKEPEEIMAKYKAIEEYLQKRKRMKKIFLFGSIITALLIVIIVLGYQFYIQGGGLGFLSSENIEIKIDGPRKAKAGDKISWSVFITNNNKISLEDARLIIEYPDGSDPVNKLSTDTLIERMPIGVIEAGGSKRKSFEAFIFGEENEEQKIKVNLEYRLKDSSAIFEKSEEKAFIISQPAVSIFIESPKEVNLGKKINFKVDIISNTSAILKNLTLDIEYPEDFKFQEASPQPSSNNARWRIGDLLGGETKTINIKGEILSKAFVQETTIRALVGIIDENGDLKVYSKKTASLEIKKPFLDVALKINGKDEYAAQTGEKLDITLEWTNNLPVGVKNAIIEAKIRGEALDLTSLMIENGSYRSFDNTIVWDSSTFQKFAYLEPEEEGKVNFSVKLKKSLPIKNEEDKNFAIDFDAKFFTSFIPAEYSNVELTGIAQKTVKIVSDLQFVQRGLFYSGHFQNTGPIPPKVGKETTYTIIWSLVNSSNDLSNVEVYAFIPSYIKWLDRVSKSDQITYDAENKKIFWRPQNIKAGTGIIRPAEEIAFQIAFLPAETHLGTSPILISKAEVSAKDDFSGVNLKGSQPAITSNLRDDPQIGSNDGKVVK